VTDFFRDAVARHRERKTNAANAFFGHRAEASGTSGSEAASKPTSIDAGARGLDDRGEPASMNSFLRGKLRANREREGEFVTLAAEEERRNV
jgi:hypothetical protein